MTARAQQQTRSGEPTIAELRAEIERLERERQRPAAEVHAAEQRLASLRADLARAEQAERERQVSAETEEQEARRREQEAKLEHLRERRLAAARDVEQATGTLGEAVLALNAINREMYHVSAALGRPNQRWLRDGVVADWVGGRLGFGRVDRVFRRPLVELLGRSPPGRWPIAPS